MKLDVPTGATFYWNPYSPKYYTIVSPNGSSLASEDGESAEERSINPIDDDEYDLGWAAISSVRSETVDSNIKAAIARLPYRTLCAVLSVLENSPSLVTELCEKERGNVVSHVMSVLGGDLCFEVVRYAVKNALRLATNQSGCIAYTRIYDAATPAQQENMTHAILIHFEELVTHPYGNFVLSRVLQNRDEATFEYVAAQLENAELLFRCVEDKFGSHVFENFVKNASERTLFRVAAVLLYDPEAVLSVATSKIANYPLQAILRQMLQLNSQHELSRWALATIPGLVYDTKFAPNINRSLGFRATTAPAERTLSPKSPKSPKNFRRVKA